MFHNIIKRCACFQLAAILLFTLIPVPSFATDTEALDNTAAGLEIEAQANTTVDADEVPEEASETDLIPNAAAPAETVSDNLTIIQDGIDQILGKYSITADMTAQQIEDAVLSMDDATFEKAVTDCYELEHADITLSLTEAELAALNEGNAEYAVFASALNTRYTEEYSVSFLASKDLLGGDLTIANNTGTLGTVTDNSYIVKAGGGLVGRQTVTLTITNVSGNKATLAFDYAASNYGSFKIAGSDASASGSYSATLDADSTLSVVIAGRSAMFAGDASLTLSNLSLTAVAAAPKVTFKCDSNLGSISVNNSVVNSGTTQEFAEGTSVAVSAAAGNGNSFLRWINESTGEILSETASFDFEPKNDITLNAVFINSASSAWFLSGGSYMFNDLNAAAAKAATLPSKVVIPMFSGTLPAGNYTIPAGVTLLIPFDSANTLCTTEPKTVAVDANNFVQPYAYRTLKMASGAHIAVNGAISLSGTQNTDMAKGTPYGPVGFITMDSGSTITINNGGKLYAWGYITGSGAVTVKSGGKVYECFQISDWRGGNGTSAMQENKYKIFPVTQYYVQNVEVPMTLEAGSAEYGHMAVNISIVGIQTTLVPFIGSESMFRISTGSIVKDYVESEDRMDVSLTNANLTIAPLEISIVLSIIPIPIVFNSKDYVLPVTSNMTLNINTGSTIDLSQDIAFLPGCEVNIAQGATCTVSNNSNIYVYDVDDWGNYCGAGNKKLTTITYAPGQKVTRTEADLVDAAIKVNGTINATNGYIYTTSGGANIYSEGTGVVNQRAGDKTVTYQATYIEDSYTPNEIPITPAQLKNGDGKSPTYTSTSSATEATTYHYIKGRWHRMVEANGEFYPTLDIVATNIAVNDGLDVNFYVNAADMVEGQTYTAVVKKHFAETIPNVPNPVEKEYISTSWFTPSQNISFRGFRFDDVSAKEMTDKIEARIYINYDTDTPILVSNTYIETVQNYAIRTLVDENVKATVGDAKFAKLQTALIDMLNYGATAQLYFKYNEENLANVDTKDTAGIISAHNGRASAKFDFDSWTDPRDTSSFSSSFAGSSVSAKNQFMFTFYFYMDDSSGKTATITVNDKEFTTISGDRFYDRKPGELYGVDVTGMSIVDANLLMECTVTDDTTGEVIGKANDSVLGYAKRMYEKTSEKIYEEMMKFAYSASLYFGNTWANGGT